MKDFAVGSVGEDAAIAAIQQTLAGLPLPAGWVGIGDDAAVTDLSPGAKALTTTDLLVEGVHFRRGTTSAWDLGWKAIAVNVSDIAGMGGSPRWATVSVALPTDLPMGWLKELYEGIAAIARQEGLAIVGGDTVGSPGPVLISVTVVGEGDRPILRTGAHPGDLVVVTGPLGASAAGLWALDHPEAASELSFEDLETVKEAQRRPSPQVGAGKEIARLASRAAMMDNSDGLVRSVLWLAQANGMGIELDAERIPMLAATRRVASHAGVDPLEWALYGGEDYSLVVLLPPSDLPAIASALMELGGSAEVVGSCMAGKGGKIRLEGQLRALDPRRIFQHFA